MDIADFIDHCRDKQARYPKTFQIHLSKADFLFKENPQANKQNLQIPLP